MQNAVVLSAIMPGGNSHYAAEHCAEVVLVGKAKKDCRFFHTASVADMPACKARSHEVVILHHTAACITHKNLFEICRAIGAVLGYFVNAKSPSGIVLQIFHCHLINIGTAHTAGLAFRGFVHKRMEQKLGLKPEALHLCLRAMLYARDGYA